VFDRLGDQEGIAHTSYGLGYCFRELGDDDKALELLNSAASQYHELAHFRGLATAIRGLGLVHRATGELVDAERYCARAHQLALDLGDRHLQCYTAQALAKTWIRGPDPHRAHEPLTTALRICCEIDDRFGAALIERTIGELHLALGNCHDAIRHLREAQTRWENIDHPLARARTLRDLGAANLQLNDHPTAHQAWRDALTTFQHLGTREASELTTWRAQRGCRCATLT
jgi:tetratricopeptide (TPR) repeat protein